MGETRVRQSDYAEAAALIIDGQLVTGGASGGPVLDPGTLAITAMVATLQKTDGRSVAFALRLSALKDWAWLQEKLRKTALPLLGPNPNAAAAREIFAARLNALLADWQQSGRFDPTRFVRRGNFDEALAQAEKSNAPCLPVIGESGVGKSQTLLAAAAATGCVGVYISGWSVAQGDRSIEQALDREIRTFFHECAPTRLPPVSIDAAALVRALSAAGTALRICVDDLGLCLRGFGDAACTWLSASVSWARQHGARLIVNCRTDVWAGLRSYAGFGEDSRSAPGVCHLGDFTTDELADARRRVGLTPRGSLPLESNPFFFSIVAQLSLDRGQSAAPAEVLRVWLEKILRKVADARRVDLVVVQNVVDALAERLVEKGNRPLAFGELPAAAQQLELLAAFRAEGLLLYERSAWHFRHDQVAAFVRARHVRLSDVLSRVQEQDHDVLKWALSLAAAEDPAALEAEIRLMIDKLDSWTCFQIAVHGFAATPLAESMLPLCLTILDKAEFQLEAACAVMADSGLPLSQQLVTVFRYVPKISHYPWRVKDWLRPERREAYFDRSFTEHAPLPRYFIRAAGRDAQGLRLALSAWLDDETPLEGGEATLGDVALAALFGTREFALTELFELALSRPERQWRLLLEALCQVEENALLETALMLIARGIPILDRLSYMQEYLSPEGWRKIAEAYEDEAQTPELNYVRLRNEYSTQHLDFVLEDIRLGRCLRAFADFRFLLEDQADSWLDVAFAYHHAGRLHPSVVFESLCGIVDKSVTVERGLELLDGAIARFGAQEQKSIAYVLEDWLYETSAAQAESSGLAGRAIALFSTAAGSARSPLIYFAFGDYREQGARPLLRQVFAASDLDDHAFALILGLLVDRTPYPHLPYLPSASWQALAALRRDPFIKKWDEMIDYKIRVMSNHASDDMDVPEGSVDLVQAVSELRRRRG